MSDTTDTTPTPEPARKALVDAVRAAGPERGLLGTNIRRFVGDDFDPQVWGCRTLRQFIQQHVPELKVIGSSGGDVIYGLSEWSPLPVVQRSAVAESAPKPQTLWRIWVSPRSGDVILVNPEASKVRRAPSASPVAEGLLAIKPLEAEEHRDIARAFIDARGELEAELRGALQSIVGSGDADWWKRWNQALAADKALLAAWYHHRTDLLQSKLRERLHEAGVPDDRVDAIAHNIASTREETIGAGYAPSRALTGSGARSPAAAAAPSMLRDVVHDVVAGMTEEQLRTVFLPIGPVLDAIMARLGKHRESRGAASSTGSEGT